MDYFKDKNLKIVLTAVSVIILLAVFYAGFSYGKSKIPSVLEVEGLGNKNLGQPSDVDFSLFWDVWKTVEEEHVSRNSLDKQEMVFGAISGMVKALGDPYTVFFKPQDSKIFRDDVSGSFEGIGAEIGIRDDILTVVSPLKNSPAENAGLKAGDKIVEINSESTEGISVTEAVKQIRGPKGTEVVLTILRKGEDIKEISIIRNTILIPVIEWSEEEGGIIHIELFSFSEEAPEKFKEAMIDVLKEDSQKIILDLRNNPGGFLESAQRIIGWFVEPGEVIAVEDFGNGRGEREYRAIGNGSLSSLDLVVLINQGSASASEITAGALRDIRGVQLVGEKSFGKGSIQQLIDLPKGSIKVTVARWLTPSGKSISQEGLNPDVEVSITEEDFEEGLDPQLEKAIELLK